MDWKCKIGFHDWEYVESMGRIAAERVALKQRAHVQGENQRPLVYKRVCLRPNCNKLEDTMTPFMDRVVKEFRLRERRSKVASLLIAEKEV